jgi:ABC-type multidrug transport system fused ATPase/permease subunit
LLKDLYSVVDQKKKLTFLLILSLIGALTDAVNIGLLIPFLKVIETPEILNNYFFYRIIVDLFSTTTNPRIFIFILFMFFLTVSAVLRIYINWFTLKISYSISEKLASKIYEQVLNRNFLEHIKENTSKTISDVTFRVDATTKVLMSIVIIINNIILSLLILSTLLYIDFSTIGFVILVIGFIYISVTFILRSRFNENSKIITKNQTSLIKSLQEGLGGIKEVILSSSQSFFVKQFNRSYSKLNISLLFNNFFAQSPKLVIETLSILLLLSFYYYSFTQGKGIAELVGLIGVLAFGAQKLIPSFQAIYQNWSNITSNKFLVIEIIKILKNYSNHSIQKKPILFQKDLKLNLNSFSYDQDEDSVLNNIDLKISKGEKIGILGSSGSGKSTLINLLVGLIPDFQGTLKVDGKIVDQSTINSWRNQIAYVPQNVFIFDASLKSNIMFGTKNKEEIGLKELLSQVKLNSFVGDRNIETIQLGERASKISGGEKQRIAIARALFKKASLIVFDEATNALDKKVERDIFEIIYQLDEITIIVISHDTKNLYGCDKVFEIKNKKIHEIV